MYFRCHSWTHFLKSRPCQNSNCFLRKTDQKMSSFFRLTLKWGALGNVRIFQSQIFKSSFEWTSKAFLLEIYIVSWIMANWVGIGLSAVKFIFPHDRKSGYCWIRVQFEFRGLSGGARARDLSIFELADMMLKIRIWHRESQNSQY